MDISVVVPVYKGEKTIGKLFEGIRKNLKSAVSFEVLFIFDCGPDRSWEVMKDLSKKYPDEIRIFRLDKNYGQHNALLFGFSRSRGDLIITMDEDLQHDPRYLVPFIEKQGEKDCDVVYGRFSDPKHSFLRNLASVFLSKILKRLIPGLGYYSSFRVLKKEIAQKTTLLKNSYTFIDGSLSSVTTNIEFINIDHKENTLRRSTYSFLKLIKHAVQIVLAYTRIIRLIIIMSISVLIPAVIFTAFNIGNQGLRTSLFSIGILFLVLGLSGELLRKREIKFNSMPVLAIEEG